MFKRIKRISERINAERAAATPSLSSRGPDSFSLRTPVVREMAIRVGKGEAASSLQQVAQAAVEEAGPRTRCKQKHVEYLEHFFVTTTSLYKPLYICMVARCLNLATLVIAHPRLARYEVGSRFGQCWEAGAACGSTASSGGGTIQQRAGTMFCLGCFNTCQRQDKGKNPTPNPRTCEKFQGQICEIEGESPG